MLLTPRQTRALYEHAVTNHYAVLAVNADSPAAIIDCLHAAKECDAPIIIETSLWQLQGHSFGAGDPMLGMNRYVADLTVVASHERFAEVPVVYHTDHIKGPETIPILKHAMDANASSISLDSSDLTNAENIRILSELCLYARTNDLEATLEMEAGVDDGVTDLAETDALFGAIERQHPGFLALWAPGVGTQHGLGDVKGFSSEAIRKHQTAASELANRPIGIALHGSSGLSNEDLQAAVASGVAKVNWSSESLLLRSQAAMEYYRNYGDRLTRTHPDFKTTAMDNGLQTYVASSYQMKVVERIRILSGAGFGKRFLQTPC
ncbi:MAG: class II fructose-bisphosphate aldolase [Verrucomicrobiota bacterium]